MARIREGSIAPDISLTTLDETPVQLASSWADGHHALIIFLRHLG